MISITSAILSIYIWGVVCLLVYCLFAIARFYEQKAGQKSYYAVFLVPIVLFALAAIKYLWLVPKITGDPVGDVMWFLGGITLMGAGYFLLKLMMGGR